MSIEREERGEKRESIERENINRLCEINKEIITYYFSVDRIGDVSDG